MRWTLHSEANRGNALAAIRSAAIGARELGDEQLARSLEAAVEALDANAAVICNGRGDAPTARARLSRVKVLDAMGQTLVSCEAVDLPAALEGAAKLLRLPR